MFLKHILVCIFNVKKDIAIFRRFSKDHKAMNEPIFKRSLIPPLLNTSFFTIL